MNLLDQLKSTAQYSATILIQSYIANNRAELIAAFEEANEIRAYAWLHHLCEQVPFAAVVVTMLMQGTPADAVVNVEKFDPELARTLAQHLPLFDRLQQHWRLHEQTKSY